ncbi:MAG: hypothetical protein U0457_13080 [Candidatus Sericytochromatia bacterium]
MTEQNIVEEKPWFTCTESGVKFKTPNGGKCTRCKNMFHAKYYVYVDFEIVCIRCRQAEITQILADMKAGLGK